MKKGDSPYIFRVIVLIAVGGLCIGTLMLVPISSNFLHYLIWRVTSTASTSKGHVRVGDVEIHYVSYGSGPVVLLLHGGLSSRLSWFSQIPWIVDSGRRVVLPDTRGHGNSGLDDGELSYRLLAADAIKILDSLSIKQVDVVGWSDGGNTALLLGLDWPQRVRRIVAISANFSPAGLTQEAQKETFEQSSGVVYWLRRWWTGAGARLRELEARIKRLWRTRPNLQPADLGKITTPTLVIVGESDIVSVSHARQMSEQLANGFLAIIPGGHFTPITHARRVNRLIAEFLDIDPMYKSSGSSANASIIFNHD
jgi:pimeloyl-ACP methyl ester carboxylesterase